MIDNQNTDLNGHSLIPFNSFLKANGRSVSCGWRWRKKGFITTINISGRLYVTPEEAERFQHRAAAGEFAKGRADKVYDDSVAVLLKNRATQQVSGQSGNHISKSEEGENHAGK